MAAAVRGDRFGLADGMPSRRALSADMTFDIPTQSPERSHRNDG